jgi:hypothetical protein
MKFVAAAALAFTASHLGIVEGRPNPCEGEVDLKEGFFLPPTFIPCGVQFDPKNVVEKCNNANDQAACFNTNIAPLISNGTVTPSPNTCVFDERFNEYECICNTFKCSEYLAFLDGLGLLENPCAAKGYKLNRIRAWWWLCVPCGPNEDCS